MLIHKIFNRIKNSKVLSNISWIVFGRIIYMLLNFVVNLLSARFLGPSNYGLLGYAAAYTTFFTSICNLGIDSIIIKELVDNKDKQGTILGTSMVLKMISSILSLITITCLTMIIDRNEPVTKMVVVLYTFYVIFNVFSTLKFWFQARLQSKNKEIATSIAYFLISGYKIFLLITNKSIVWFAISNSLEFFIIGLILYYMYRKNHGDKLSFSKIDARRILKNSYHFIFTGLMVALYNSTDRFMLKQMIDSSEVSYYTVAVSVSSLYTFLLSAIIESITPAIIEEHGRNYELYKKRNRQLYAVIFYISIFMSLLTAIFSRFIILLLYGEKYANSVSSLIILTWYTAFSYLGVARDIWVVCEKKQRYLKYIYFCCALCNIILNYFLIPRYGASGAAFASLITQICTIIVFPLFIKDFKENIKLMFDGITLKNIK